MSEREYPYNLDRLSTHWEDCFKERNHHNCAVQRVYDLEDELKALAKRYRQLIELFVKQSHAVQMSPLMTAALLLDSGVTEEEFRTTFAEYQFTQKGKEANGE